VPLVAGRAPDRPVGRAHGLAGHGTEAGVATPPLLDRAGSPAAPLSEAGRALHERFVAAIDDDLDLPIALRIARETLRATSLSADERRWLVLDMDFVLGLDLHRSVPGAPSRHDQEAAVLSPRVAELLHARTNARHARNFAEADRLRDELTALGIEVIDRPDGSSEARPTT
jgi:cysteinyl-tRNA synthetase